VPCLTITHCLLLAEAKRWLSEQIMYLLNHDFNKLVNLLYRIDVTRVPICFGKTNHEIADCLAELIWERQWKKLVANISSKQARLINISLYSLYEKRDFIKT
jgi:hypothetical protein